MCKIKYTLNRYLHTRSEKIGVQPGEVKVEEANIFTSGRLNFTSVCKSPVFSTGVRGGVNDFSFHEHCND